MKIFLAGIACVGKSTIGAYLAQRLGYGFYDLDTEIETHFGRPIERLRAEAVTPYSFRRLFASVVLRKLVKAKLEADFVMALMPSGLMDCMWTALKKVDRVVIVLRDAPENVLARLTFYDADSRLITKTLTDEQRPHYLREIRDDIAYYGRSFRKADLTVDINGLDVEASARKIEYMLREWRAEADRRFR